MNGCVQKFTGCWKGNEFKQQATKKRSLCNESLFLNCTMSVFIQVENLPSKEIVTGFHARTIHTGTMTFVYWTVEAGHSIPLHSHLHEQVAHVLNGEFELTVADETRILTPGLVAVI